VIRHAFYDYVVVVDGHDTVDDSGWQAITLEGSALLDVQLDICVVLSACDASCFDAVRVASDAVDRFSLSHSVRDLLQFVRSSQPGRQPATV
jgi:hypothetical protein